MFNVVRFPDIPASLANKTKYDGDDVFKALRLCFHDKCYICETKEPHDINVEHFISHRNKDKEKKFDWSNLYFVCGRCNNIKGTAFDNLLDCCDPSVDVYRSIRLLPPRTPRASSVQIEAKVQGDEAEKTVELLSRIYNSSKTINKEISSEYLRRKIYQQINKMQKYILIWYSDEMLDHEKRDALERIRLFIRSSAPYSGFARDLLLEDEGLSFLIDELSD